MATKPKSKTIVPFNTLPVAPEFVEALQENAFEVVKDQLEALKVPKEVIDLVGKVYDLGYYVVECYRDPQLLTRDKADRLDIEQIVIETINCIAELGAEFHGPVTIGPARKTDKPTKSKK